MKAVLGVDGGNTKTDYLLHDLSGRLLAWIRAGTCSHERLAMDGARREMEKRIGELLKMAGLSKENVVAAAFGLAGIDQPPQQKALTRIVHEMGFSNSIAMNDSFLGVKVGSESGIGICSVNGTGTAAGGIDRFGTWRQVGGMGAATGDFAGGAYIAQETVLAVYNEIFRFGRPTRLTAPMLSLFGCDAPDDFHTAYSTEYVVGRRVRAKEIIEILFSNSPDDPVAHGIVRRVALELAKSAAGCAARLRFDGVIPVVLIGSVWTKGRHPPMIYHFQAEFRRLSQKPCQIILPKAPPAAGSVLWALELAEQKPPGAALREAVLAETAGL